VCGRLTVARRDGERRGRPRRPWPRTEENLAAARISLTEAEVDAITALAPEAG
jgi:hypothetical protein